MPTITSHEAILEAVRRTLDGTTLQWKNIVGAGMELTCRASVRHKWGHDSPRLILDIDEVCGQAHTTQQWRFSLTRIDTVAQPLTEIQVNPGLQAGGDVEGDKTNG